MPECLPPEAAALTEPLACALHAALACALHAVDLAGLRPGATALVFGADPIGILCAALLGAAGASKIVVREPNIERRIHVRDFRAEPAEPDAVAGFQAGVMLERVGRVETTKVGPLWAEIRIKPREVFRRESTIRDTYVYPIAFAYPGCRKVACEARLSHSAVASQ